jgi:hypothetical protein
VFLIGHKLAAELQALVGFEHGFEVRPIGLVHVVEGVEINGDCLRRVFGEQNIDGGAKLFIRHRFGKVFDDAFVVLDTKGVEKIDKHAFVLFNEPGADEIAGNQLEGRASESGEHLGMAFGSGLAFQEDGAHLAGLGNRMESSAIKWFVRFKGVGENFKRQLRRHEPVKFVRCKHLTFRKEHSCRREKINDVRDGERVPGSRVE